ncbi:hypothetical protein POM88_036969 [Heracleum sosnowskyi]|uniref:Uncharacterized protein n=1 Tax=Heracleum sosnowskyi TaxID=360622 RepID=A0AAD8MFF8_9APIA|nr:hypothetical protein POM88_036969 [Heracleum sosnowskyi]
MEWEGIDEAVTSSSSCKAVEGEELSVFFRQLKHLHNLTEHALQKSRPLVISNLRHEKSLLISGKDLTDASQPEQTCLLALTMRAVPGYPSVEISVKEVGQEENLEPGPSSNKGNTTSVAAAATISESDLPLIVSVIQSSYAESINEVIIAGWSRKKYCTSLGCHLIQKRVKEKRSTLQLFSQRGDCLLQTTQTNHKGVVEPLLNQHFSRAALEPNMQSLLAYFRG